MRHTRKGTQTPLLFLVRDMPFGGPGGPSSGAWWSTTLVCVHCTREHRLCAMRPPCKKTPLGVTFPFSKGQCPLRCRAAFRELAHAPRTQVKHRAVVCTRLACCRVLTSTTTVQCQVLCSSAALNHARGSDWHARTWQCSGHHQDRQCHVAQRACRHFERIYASIATLFHYLLTSTPLDSVLALACQCICYICGCEHQVAASARAPGPTRWMWGRRWCVRASGKGRRDRLHRIVTFRGVLLHCESVTKG